MGQARARRPRTDGRRVERAADGNAQLRPREATDGIGSIGTPMAEGRDEGVSALMNYGREEC